MRVWLQKDAVCSPMFSSRVSGLWWLWCVTSFCVVVKQFCACAGELFWYGCEALQSEDVDNLEGFFNVDYLYEVGVVGESVCGW